MVELIFLDQIIPVEIIQFIYFIYFKLKMEEISDIMRTKISCGRKSSVICHKGLLYIAGAWNPFDYRTNLFDKFTYCGIKDVDFVGHSNAICYAIFLKNNKVSYLSDWSNDTIIKSITFEKEEINFDDDILGIKSGDGHTLIITKEKKLFGWGNNDYGQLGLGNRDFKHSFEQIPINNVISFECGDSHTLVLTNQGLFGCGDNNNNMLCLNTFEDILTLTLIDINNVISFACGYHYSLVMTNEGLFYGGKDYGLFKNKIFHSNNIAFFKIELPISNIIKFSCADKYSLILTTKALYILRFLYDQFMVKYQSIKRIEIENVLDINCGKEHDIILTKEGLFGCGNNSSFQLGLGDNVERFYYAKIELIYNNFK
jgi:hypothetical protein